MRVTKHATVLTVLFCTALLIAALVLQLKTSEETKHLTYDDHSKFPERNKFGINYNETNLSELKSYFFDVNNQQLIYNKDLYRGIDLVIVVQVHDRIDYLKLSIASLSSAYLINKALLIFSHDVYDPRINFLIRSINFTKVMQIFYPHSIQVHPGEFPGPDAAESNRTDVYGRYRNAEKAQMKHHWWWKVNFVFSRIGVLKNYKGLVLFLEEDHYVARDFIHCLKLMRKKADESCPRCWFLSLAFWRHLRKVDFRYDKVMVQDSVENLGLAFNRSVWYYISRLSEVFCKYDDYNWDWTLRYMVYNVIKPKPLSMIMSRPRVEHIGICGVHAYQPNSCNATKFVEDFNNKQVKLFPTELKMTVRKNVYKIEKNGGWGDPRDHILCLGMT